MSAVKTIPSDNLNFNLSCLLSQKEKEIQERFDTFERKVNEKEGQVETVLYAGCHLIFTLLFGFV